MSNRQRVRSVSRSAIARFALGAVAMGALVAVVLLTAWKAQPWLSDWQRERLARELADRAADATDDRLARRLVEQLAELTPMSVELLAEFAAGQRAATSVTAQAAIDRLVGHWDVLAAENLAGDDMAEQMSILAVTLAERADRFGPAGQQWVRHVMLRILDHSAAVEPRRAAGMLAACDRALSVIPAPTGASIGDPRSAAPSPAVSLSPPPIDVAALAASTPADIEPLAPPPAKPVGADAIVAAPRSADRRGGEARPLQWQGGARPLQSTTPSSQRLIDNQTSKQDAAIDNHPRQRQISNVVDVPSPQAMRWLKSQYWELSSQELSSQLPVADRYRGTAIRDVLAERRNRSTSNAAAGEPPLPGDAVAGAVPTATLQPAELIEQIAQLPASEARGRLRELVADENADVRLEALTALATSGDPRVEALAEDRALHDNDDRVADLAAKILRELR